MREVGVLYVLACAGCSQPYESLDRAASCPLCGRGPSKVRGLLTLYVLEETDEPSEAGSGSDTT